MNAAEQVVNQLRKEHPEMWASIRTEILTNLIVGAAAKKIAKGLTLEEAIKSSIDALVNGDD
jgi:hypothetical protein